ncbi:MAG TPA: hypothetical protein VFN72_13950 [Solirubrobacterales bacterium]|nr:hypothetical protein [Solirubrobacterales bacterium]
MKTRAAILVGLHRTVVAVNGGRRPQHRRVDGTSTKPEPLRATSQRPLRVVERTLSAQVIQPTLANFLR